MNILLFHNSYINYGGEDTVFFSERSLLDLNGNSINCFVSNNSIVNNLHEKIKVSFFLTHSKVSKLMAVRLIFECNPSQIGRASCRERV